MFAYGIAISLPCSGYDFKMIGRPVIKSWANDTLSDIELKVGLDACPILQQLFGSYFKA